MEASISKNCSFCQKKNSLYCCPRCGLFYCSVKCYQHIDHLLCSESFYKGWIEASAAELGTNDKDSKRKMYDILKRINDAEEKLDSDDENIEEVIESENCASILENKLDELNLEEIDGSTNFDLLWDSFSPEECEKIKQELEKENAMELIETWKPWWEIPARRKKLVEELDLEKAEVSKAMGSNVPDIPKHIISFNDLTKKEPSPSIVFNLLNILGSYVYVARRYNGDYTNEVLESVPLLYRMSGTLYANKNYDTLELAIFALGDEDLRTFSVNLQREELVLIMHDVCKLLEASSEDHLLNFSLGAISDSINLFKAFKVLLKTSHARIGVFDLSKQIGLNQKTISLVVKKLEYFLSWIFSKSTKKLKKLIPQIQLVIANIVEDDVSFKEVAENISSKTSDSNDKAKTKVLVEEM